MALRKAVGVDFGGTNIRVALVVEDGTVEKKSRESTVGADAPAILRRMVGELMPDNPVGIGIGVAGLVNHALGQVSFAPNIKGLESVRFKELFDGGLPVAVENDANAAALGELRFGAGRRYRSFVLLTLGTGIGGGVVKDGALLHMPSEAGHISIVSDGPRCECGNNGCLELYASARAILTHATKALEGGEQSILKECCRGNIYRVTPEDIYKAAFDGDALSRELLRNAGRALGVGIANMVNIFGPDAVILMGGLTGAWDIYVEEAIKEATRRAIKALSQKVEIVRSELGTEDAGVVGAASQVMP